MTHYTESNFYELLEVEPGSPPADIDAAYKKQMDLLSGAALATYGLFVGNDLVAARQRVEDAYRVLRDPVRRRAYDASGYRHAPEVPAEVPASAPPEVRMEAQAPGGFAPPAPPPPPVAEGPAEPLPPAPPAEVHAEVHAEAPAPPAPAPPGPHVPGAPAPASFDGPGFRAVREAGGVSLGEISARTRIAEYYLGYIEEERFDLLPPVIYLRSYLRQYATAIGLDPEIAINDYLARYNDKRGRKQPDRS